MTQDTGIRRGLLGSRSVRIGVGITVGLVAAMVLSGVLSNGDEDDGTIEVSDPWVRATIPMGDADGDQSAMAGEGAMGRVTGAFMTIRNTTGGADRLVGASTDVAGVVEIHETTIENDVMRMRPIEGVDIPAGGSAELKPGGLHIMLMNVQQDLEPGQTVTLTLTFESGLSLDVEAPVRPLE